MYTMYRLEEQLLQNLHIHNIHRFVVSLSMNSDMKPLYLKEQLNILYFSSTTKHSFQQNIFFNRLDCLHYLKSNWAKLYRLFLQTGQV
jgi:hypothetical protein